MPKMPTRKVALFAAVTLTTGAAILTHALPPSVAEAWFGALGGQLVPVLGLGLLVALIGTSAAAARLTSRPRTRRVPAIMTPEQSPRPLRPISLTLSASGHHSGDASYPVPLKVTLLYDPANPFSMFLDISDPDASEESEGRGWERWEVGRELLYDACVNGLAVGLGDFSACAVGDGIEAVALRLWDTSYRRIPRAERAHLDIIASRPPLREFLAATVAMVPLGAEENHLNVDRLLEQLLSR